MIRAVRRRAGRAALTMAVGASVLALGLAGCGGGTDRAREAGNQTTPQTGKPKETPDGAETSGRAATPRPGPTHTGGSTYVFNTVGSEQGKADRMPKRLAVSEFTTFTSLSWSGWIDDRAAGRGQVRGTWCLPDCAERGYPAKLRLLKPRQFDGTRFFTRYTVDAKVPAKYRQAFEDAEAGGSLMTPG